MGGCFLACFGSTNKRKRLKCFTNSISSKQVHGKYVPLDSEYSKISSSNNKVKKKEKSSLKVKKKVSFNLEVINTYEPLNYDDNDIDNNLYFSEGEEETKWELNEEETLRATLVCWHQQKVNVTNYRYQNIQECYDEDDEIMVDDSDLDDDIIFDHDEDVKQRIHLLPRIPAQESREIISTRVSHFNDIYVLNSIENVSRWKSMKARERMKLKRQKETIITEQENQEDEEKADFSESKLLQHEIGVNVSLANWLHASH